jgi:light-regulated signal transduction histidine kinase (bacteriophytochrome)
LSPWIIIVILGACAIAYAFIMPRKDKVQQPSHQLVQEMESTLEHYMTEIEQDNDALIQRVAELKGEATAADHRMQSQLKELQQRLDQLEQQKGKTNELTTAENITVQRSEGLQAQSLMDSVRAETNQEVVSASELQDNPAQEEDQKRESIKDRYTELFRLHDEGKSMDAISRQTGIQLGEVQLILQLAEREES